MSIKKTVKRVRKYLKIMRMQSYIMLSVGKLSCTNILNVLINFTFHELNYQHFIWICKYVRTIKALWNTIMRVTCSIYYKKKNCWKSKWHRQDSKIDLFLALVENHPQAEIASQELRTPGERPQPWEHSSKTRYMCGVGWKDSVTSSTSSPTHPTHTLVGILFTRGKGHEMRTKLPHTLPPAHSSQLCHAWGTRLYAYPQD